MNALAAQLLRHASLAALVIVLSVGGLMAQEDATSSSSDDLPKTLLSELERQVALPMPENGDPQEQCVFYHKRGIAHTRLGRYDLAISDLKQALSYNQPSRLTPNHWGDRWRIQNDLRNAYRASGSNLEQIRYLMELAAEQRHLSKLYLAKVFLIEPYVNLGMIKEAEEVLRAAAERLPALKSQRNWHSIEHNIMGIHLGYSAWLKEIRGNHAEGERLRRTALEHATQWLREMERIEGSESQILRIARNNVTADMRGVAAALSAQWKVGEAEYLAQEALTRTLLYETFNTTNVSAGLSVLRGIKLQQGQLIDAGRYARLALQAIEKANVQPASRTLADRRGQLGLIEVMQERYPDALEIYDIRDQGLRSNPDEYAKRGSADLDWSFALLRTGNASQSIRMLERNLNYNLRHGFTDLLAIAHRRGYLGVALTENGNDAEALSQYQQCLPVLLTQANETASDSDAGFVNTYRLRIVVEGYLELLARMHEAGRVIAGLDFVGESFKLADIARNSSVQRAVTSSAARATLPDHNLAQLARREQDATNQRQALNKILARLASAPEEKRLQKVIDDMQREIERLGNEQVSLRKELLQKFPDYAALVDPQAATPADIQKRLSADEAVISLYSGERQAYVWTITKDSVRFRAIPLTRKDIQREVGKVLKSVDLSGDQSKPFEIDGAQLLYAKLLAPDAKWWAKVSLVNVIPHGPLGQLPFALLLTEPVKPPVGRAPPHYREMPWLINQVAIAQQSSASSFLALRQSTPAGIERKPFVGFGDPLFVVDAAAGRQRGKRVRSLTISRSPDEALKVLERVVESEKPLVGEATLRSRPTLGEAFSFLPPLPDTADELKEIAETTGGSLDDIYLGTRATESNVKSVDLTRYRVLAFATHGLVPGEVSGLDQPALALTNPALIQDANNDGFLTLEEVLGLKLNADWVVLSACNTASADGQASEAVSGLGRAFFYAGARSLLVSNWAVETVSARLLTTGLFKQQGINPAISRAEALRQSMRMLMKSETADYDHPAFWAPFSLVGDGQGSAL